MDQKQHFLDGKNIIFLKSMKLFLTSIVLLELAAIVALLILFILTLNILLFLGIILLGVIEGIATYYLLAIGANRIAKWYFREKE